MFAFDMDLLLPPVLISLKVALLSSLIVLLIGGLVSWGMSLSDFRGKTLLETFFLLPLVLPPTVVGFILLMLLGKKSWIGSFIEFIFNRSIIFTWGAAVIASIVVAFPLVYQTMKAGFSSVDPEIEDVARTMGANEWQVARYITIPLAWRSVLTAYILGFARSMGEFGATLMIAGNIHHKTQTMPTAIYTAVESGNLTLAWMWTAGIIIISFILLLIVRPKKSS